MSDEHYVSIKKKYKIDPRCGSFPERWKSGQSLIVLKKSYTILNWCTWYVLKFWIVVAKTVHDQHTKINSRNMLINKK